MGDDADSTRLLAFEARLAALANKVQAGFPERAKELRVAIDALATDEASSRDATRRLAHKVRGTAGSHGFAELTELGASVEALAVSGSSAALVVAAQHLADALDRAGPSTAASSSAPVRAPAPAPSSAAGALAGLRVVAVDDDPSTRKLLTLTLVNVGKAEAIVDERPEELLAHLRQQRFDLVVVDAMMPEMNGLACLTQIVAEGLHREGTRYFVLSAATAEELAWSLPVGLTVGWLRKPFRPRELVDAIAERCGR